MSQSCPIVVAHIVSKLPMSCLIVALGVGRGVVYEGWRGAQIFGRQSQTWNSCSLGAWGVSIRSGRPQELLVELIGIMENF